MHVPLQVVPTPGTIFHNLVTGIDDPRGEPPEFMAKASLLLATEPLDRVTGRVTYSQQILQEFGWITEAKGTGVTRPSRQRLLPDLVADGASRHEHSLGLRQPEAEDAVIAAHAYC